MEIFVDGLEPSDLSMYLRDNIDELVFTIQQLQNSYIEREDSQSPFTFNKSIFLDKQVFKTSNIKIIVTTKKLVCPIDVFNELGVRFIVIDCWGYDIRKIAELVYTGYCYYLQWDGAEKPYGEKLLNIPLPDHQMATLGRIRYNPPSSPVHLIITHGIQDHGEWGETTVTNLRLENISASFYRYIWVDIFVFFVFSALVKKKYAQELLSVINQSLAEHEGKRVSILAHSFGSIVLAEALSLAEKLNVKIPISEVILVGSILPRAFNWRSYTRTDKTHGVTIRRVINICGDKDYWPIASHHFIRGTGYSGSFFFSDSNVNGITNIRLTNCNHSDVVNIDKTKELLYGYLSNSKFSYDKDSPPPTKRLKRIDFALVLLKYTLIFTTSYLGYKIIVSLIG